MRLAIILAIALADNRDKPPPQPAGGPGPGPAPQTSPVDAPMFAPTAGQTFAPTAAPMAAPAAVPTMAAQTFSTGDPDGVGDDLRIKTISKPPGRSYVSGVWTYSPPRSLDNTYEYGQYVYSPADVRGCRRNLTFHVAGAAFDACRAENTPDGTTIYGRTGPLEAYVYVEYLESYECIPDALMLAARTADIVNEKRLIDIPGAIADGLSMPHLANVRDPCALTRGRRGRRVRPNLGAPLQPRHGNGRRVHVRRPRGRCQESSEARLHIVHRPAAAARGVRGRRAAGAYRLARVVGGAASRRTPVAAR